jgi:membrane-associated phospholipid phosphatase
MKYLLTALIISSMQLGCCMTVMAQATKLDPPNPTWANINAANIVSFFPVAASIGYDTYKSWHSSDRKRAFLMQGARAGIDIGVAELVKRMVHRNRPDNSDSKSFYSEHTELTAMGVSWQVSIPLAAGAGYTRMAANKHYLTDVLVGLGAGFLTGRYIK